MNKFGTYHRDQTTGLDYADQRYFTSLSGRYLTEDPCRLADSPRNPVTWNRYTYVLGDPINFNDPTGLLSDDVLEQAPQCNGGGGGGGGFSEYAPGKYRGRPLGTQEERLIFISELASAAALALNAGLPRVVTHLQTVEDCLVPKHSQTGAPARYRKYVAYRKGCYRLDVISSINFHYYRARTGRTIERDSQSGVINVFPSSWRGAASIADPGYHEQ